MKSQTNALLVISSCLLLAASTGCGSGYQTGDIEAVVPVNGTLTFQGKPLENYQVVFMPLDGRRVATGVTDANGNFKMGTNTAGDGAPPGKCEVAVQFAPPDMGQPGNEVIIDNPAKLPKPKVKIPTKYGDPKKSGITQEVPSSGLKDLKIDLK